ncbi:Signal transduction histidine kinase [Streptosporangium subroseum]|uniref:Oxygen sensor histidine kinase NreB n=1 Tax=Streptosporangium subroseum TaxID=106412 RepID=A0A239MNQ4_9ACTN|nr:sensor histidine kinase [Streptosporangium subroseum]SNT44351.1 Signal transduction histidine kinase [Streptosporangium subroseum]
MASDTTAESWGDRFFRWGPYALLGLGTLLGAATAGLFLMTRGEKYATGSLIVAALVLHLWWNRTGPGRPEHNAAGRAYYVVRFALGFALTWLNPFFAVYAVLGYFDADRLLPRRQMYAGMFATAVTMAGSQSGGLPPAGGLQWVAFGALFALNVALTFVFADISLKDAKRAKDKAATITELELANSRLEQALEENAGLHAQLLVQAREAGVNDERRRLAAEIHDTIAQGLAGIITQLQAAVDSADPGAAHDHVERAATLARHSLGEARRSVQDLGPGALEHDTLPDALKNIVETWSDSMGVRAEFTVTGTVEPLHDEIEATVLRIAQEALANAGRHARAKRVGVTLSYMDDEVSLDVRDDGGGFNPYAALQRETGRGFGLGGMRARAERIAGTVDIESEPGHGTAVSARVPLVRHG